jgi:chaperone required for assembly of F1-ATPase
MKRRYTEAGIVAAGDLFAIALDGKTIRTPAKRDLVVPTRALAAAIAAEWQAQGDEVKPHTMPLTRLASTAIDLVAQRREQVVEEIVAYAGSDLLCYRAEQPPELIAREHAAWQPLVDWATLRYDAPLIVTSGILPVRQLPETMRAFAAAVEEYDHLLLTALHAITTVAGSLVIALAVLDGRIDAAEAFAAAQLDETFEIEKWGEDEEQSERRAALRDDIAAAAQFAALLREGVD